MFKSTLGSICAAALLGTLTSACGPGGGLDAGDSERNSDGETNAATRQAVSAFVGQAFQASTGKLWGEGADTGLAMKAGTNPAASGSINATCYAVQNSSGVVLVWRAGVLKTAGAAVGSPAVAETGMNCFAAYRTTANQLDVFDFNANKTTTWSVSLTSNPSVTVSGTANLSVAYRGSNGHLFVLDTLFPPTLDTGLVVASGSSPSIIGTGDGRWVAYRGSNGTLWMVSDSTSAHDFGLGIAAGTSPAISSSAGNWVVAFHAAGSDRLWTGTQNGSGTGVWKEWTVTLASGTGPAIRRFGGGTKILLQSRAGTLNLVDTAANSTTDLKFGMAANTSPAFY